MYRLLLTILLCLKAAAPAPQSKESDVTYVKIQPVVQDTSVDAASGTRESRIEKLPLTIPGNVSKDNGKEPDPILTKNPDVNRFENPIDTKADLVVSNSDSLQNKSDLTDNKTVLSETDQSDNIPDVSNSDEVNTTDDLPVINPTDDLSESNSDINLSDTVPSDTSQSERRARNFDAVETTETAEDVTDKYEDELIDYTAAERPRTRSPPKFIPKPPKLSYFQKPRVFQSYSSNLLENGGKRKFRSHCSCQKIWNCPKLQITVPRCPNEYFLCCF